MADYQRKCINWLDTYQKWVIPRMNAPPAYIFWAGISCLASAIRRKVYIGHSTLGSWEAFPHCFIILVGPPGFRKNTAMGPAIELLQAVSDYGIITRAPSLITKESLVDSIFKSPDSSIYLVVEEFGDILLKSGPDMYELLTSLFDAKKHLDQRTMGRGGEFAERPCVNLLAGTTPQWISTKMPESVIGGGLASRIIFIYEDKAPDDRIFFRTKSMGIDFNKLKDDLVSDLAHISNNIEGEFLIDENAQDWMEDWNKKRRKGTDPKLAGYYARKITHTLKIAQLFHLSYSDELSLSRSDLEGAIGIVETIEKNLPKVFAGVGKNIYSLDIKDIHSFIVSNPNVTRDRLLRNFNTVATVDKMEILIDGLLRMKMISSEIIEGGIITYKTEEVKDEVK